MPKKRDYEQELIDSVRALNRGEGRKFTITVPDDVKELRAKIGLSQAEFATRFNISIKTLQKWEQGDTKPTGPAVSLLDIISKHPEVFINKDSNSSNEHRDA